MTRLMCLFCLISLVFSGCKSPQTALQNLQTCSPHFSEPALLQSSLETAVDEKARSVEEFVELGLSQNPSLAEARYRIEALRHQIPQVMALPDPNVNTNTYLAPVQTAAGEQEFSLGISQKIVRSERRATKAAMLTDEIQAAESSLDAIGMKLAADIRKACYQLDFIRKSIEITQEDAELLKQIAGIVERQYRVKKSVTQQDVLNIQIEQSKVENNLAELAQKEKSGRARLARLIHLDPGATLEMKAIESLESLDLDLDVLINVALQSRPELQAQLSSIRRSHKAIELAELQNSPDFTVGLNWISTSSQGISPVANSDDSVILGVGFNLPINKQRIRAAVCQARASAMASTSKLASLQDGVAEEIFDLVAKTESTSETLGLIREDIIPKSERTLRLSMEEYQNGKMEYVQLINNWRMLLRYRLADKRLESELHQTLASLSRSVGRIDAPTELNNLAPAARRPVDAN